MASKPDARWLSAVLTLVAGTVCVAEPLPPAGPVLDADALISCRKAAAWQDAGSTLMLVEGDLTVSVGSYGFRGDRAVVRVDTESAPGRRVRRLAIYLDNVRPLRGKGSTLIEAPRLLVTVTTTGRIELDTDLLEKADAAPGDALVADAAARVQRYIDESRQPRADVPEGGELFGPEVAALRDERRRELEEASRLVEEQAAERVAVQPFTPAPATQSAPAPPPPTDREPRVLESDRVLPGDGVVSFNADRVVFEQGEKESTLVLIGHVRVLYQDKDGREGMSLTAENAVIFLSPQTMQGVADGKADPSMVRGVYLEDNVVASDGDFTVRAPRVYYDLATNKALVLDAVMYTWDVKRQVPIYVRADRLRQTSRRQWSASNAAVTTSEFAEPHFAIAAGKITVQREGEGDDASTYVTARDMTARAGRLPLFYWPKVAGEASEAVPLRRIEVGGENNGATVRTSWDAFALAGRQAPEGVDLEAQIDYLGDHGPAVGLDLEYDRPDFFGYFDGYLAGYDQGEDEIADRNDIEFDGDQRGYALWRHRHYLRDNWELSIEGSYVSDETFLEEYFTELAEADKPWETSLYLKKQEDDWAFTFLARYDINDFVVQTSQLQPQPFNVDKLPELGYYRVGTSLWDNRLTYYTENRLGRVRFRPDESSPAERGFNNLQSLLSFGFAPASVSFDDVTDAFNIPEETRTRFDSRHELQAPLKVGTIDVVPYIAGRFTAYDDNFDETFFGTDDNMRGWGAAGVRLHTQFHHTDPTVESRMFDLHGVRHIIEPSADLWYARDTLNQEDESFLLYDIDVEGIDTGPAARVGLRNTWQTQRGGEGRWRTVDWIVLNTDYIYRRDDMDNEFSEGFNDIARFYGYRPEYSLGGDHFISDLAWMLTDNFALAGEVIYNADEGSVSTWRVGGAVQHTARLRTYGDYAAIDELDSRLLALGVTYQLTTKYAVGYRHVFDLDEGGSREIEATLERRLPRWRVLVFATHDDVDDEQTVGVVLIPEGIRSGRLLGPFDAGPR